MKTQFVQFIRRLRDALRERFGIKIKTVEPPSALAERAEWDKKLVFSLAKQRFPRWPQLQYLPRYLSRKEKIIIRLLLAIMLGSLAFLIVRFYQRHVVYLPRPGGTYSEALVGQPTYLNPLLAQNDVDRDITRLVYSGLFKYDEKFELVPDLAERYEISEDKKTYTVFLKPNTKWQNGNALLADDVTYTFETIQDAEFSSPYYTSFRGVTIERVDDRTVKFTLPEPFTPFLSSLTIGILPAHLWSDIPATNFKLAEYNNKPVGSGPYKFQELTKDRAGTIKTYVLIRNNLYYGPKPNIDKIIFKFYGDFESAVATAKNNNVDGVSYLPKDLKASLGKNEKIVVRALNLPQYAAVFFNQKNALLKNKEIKQALAYAVDKQRVLQEALKGQGNIIDAPVLEGFLGYNADVKKYEYNAQKAAEILDGLGWKVPDDGGLRQKDGNELKFSLTTVDQLEYLKTAEILQENWEALHIGIELKIMNPGRVDKEVIRPRNYEAFLYGEILGFDPDPYPFWHSSQSLSGGLNLSNYYNKDVDKLLEEARRIDSAEERAKKYIDFQNIIAEEVPALFLYSPSYDYGVSRKVKGITITRITIPSDRFNGIEGWYIKTKLGWK